MQEEFKQYSPTHPLIRNPILSIVSALVVLAFALTSKLLIWRIAGIIFAVVLIAWSIFGLIFHFILLGGQPFFKVYKNKIILSYPKSKNSITIYKKNVAKVFTKYEKRKKMMCILFKDMNRYLLDNKNSKIRKRNLALALFIFIRLRKTRFRLEFSEIRSIDQKISKKVALTIMKFNEQNDGFHIFFPLFLYMHTWKKKYLSEKLYHDVEKALA